MQGSFNVQGYNVQKTLSKFKSFESMEIWQLAREISKELFHLYKSSPLKQDSALWHQINKASGSVMDNIAEGFERNGNKEFRQFLSVAKASCGELRSQIYRCYDRNYLDKESFENLIGKVLKESRKISLLLSYLSKSGMEGSKFRG